MCFGFGNKVSRSRRLPSTRARLTLEPTRPATLLCASLPFCFFFLRRRRTSQLGGTLTFHRPGCGSSSGCDSSWLLGGEGDASRPQAAWGDAPSDRTTRQRPATTENSGRPALAHGAHSAHTTARYPARKLGVRSRRTTGALPGARARTPARVNRHVSVACNRHVSAACNRCRLAHHDACKSTQLASYLDRSVSDSGF